MRNFQEEFAKQVLISFPSGRPYYQLYFYVCIMSDFGPSLPPGEQLGPSNLDDCDETSSNKDTNGKNNLQNHIIGPALPPHLASMEKQCSKNETSAEATTTEALDDVHVKSGEANAIGPSFPSYLQNDETSRPRLSETYMIEDSDAGNDSFGPSMPPEFIKSALPNSRHSIEQDFSEDDEDEIIGPVLPPSIGNQSSSYSERIAEEFDARSKAMKDKLLGLDKSDDNIPVQRESWMLTLPAKRLPNEQKGAGLKARTFGKSAAPTNPSDDDASIWTDTPADRARKAREEESGILLPAHAPTVQDTAFHLRDRKMAKEAERLKAKRGTDSLVDIHQKKKEKETTGPKERRPFDRERDLQIPSSLGKSSDAVSKSKGFQSRFSSGQQKFL